MKGRMKLFNQEVLRVVLLDTRYRHISTVDITKSYAFVLVDNHPSGHPAPSEVDIRLTRRLADGARILQINMADHVIVGQPFDDRPGYFSFKEAGMI